MFTLGGDGTAIEVIGALAHVGPPVGILPGGTGNVVARTLGTPANIGRAVRALLDGDEARIDLGVLGTGERFAIGMGVGLDATMIANAPGPLKRRIGFAAYVIGALKAFVKLEKFTVRLTVDGEDARDACVGGYDREFRRGDERSDFVWRRNSAGRWCAERVRVFAAESDGMRCAYYIRWRGRNSRLTRAFTIGRDRGF